MSGPRNDYGYLSDQDAADVLGGGHPKSIPVDVAFGMDDGMDDGDGYDDGSDGDNCDCDPAIDDNCDCGD